MVATSLGLPYEIYELVSRFTVFKLALFAVNLLLVLYLVITRRLFGVRGGKEAYEARLRSESIMDAAIREAADDAGTPQDAPPPAGTAPPPPAEALTPKNAPGTAPPPPPAGTTSPTPAETLENPTSHALRAHNPGISPQETTGTHEKS